MTTCWCSVLGRSLLLVFLVHVLVLLTTTTATMMPGGLTEAHSATPEEQALADQIKTEAESRANGPFETFTAVKVATQVVAGTNYFMKIDVGGGNFIHVRIYKTLPHAGSEVSLHSVQVGETSDSPIQYFPQ